MNKLIAVLATIAALVIPGAASAESREVVPLTNRANVVHVGTNSEATFNSVDGLVVYVESIPGCVLGHAGEVVVYYKNIPAAFDEALDGKTVLEGILNGVFLQPLDVVFTTVGHAVGIPVCAVPESLREVVLAPSNG